MVGIRKSEEVEQRLAEPNVVGSVMGGVRQAYAVEVVPDGTVLKYI